MHNKRESNFELLRLFSMIFIVLFHVIIYGSLISEPYNAFTIPSLMICAITISAVYAFMALSSYFLLEANKKPILPSVLTIGAQALFIYVIKSFVLFQGLKLPKDNFFVKEFFVVGAWWFIYAYFVILLIYPLLNKIIFTVKKSHLAWICVGIGVIFVINGFITGTNFVRDVIAFIFTYFIIGFLKRSDFNYLNRKSWLIIVYLLGYILTVSVGVGVKVFDVFQNNDVANQLVNFFIGRYCFIQFIMGISLFYIFKNMKMKYHKWINDTAKITLYMFLLHETIIAVFWHCGKLQTVDGRLPYADYKEFIMWLFIYMVCVLVVAFVTHLLYQLLLKKVVDWSIQFLCKLSVVQKYEKKYFEVTEWRK